VVGGAPIGSGIAVLLCLSAAYGGKKSLQVIQKQRLILTFKFFNR